MSAYPLVASLKTLIGSLSTSQKRYFRLYVGSPAGGENTARYLRLFDAINQHLKNEEETEEQLIAGLLKRGAVKRHEISKLAGYLYDKILESMRTIPESMPARAGIAGALQDARFLLDKELFADCLAVLKRASEQLDRYDYPELRLELLTIERRVYTRSEYRQFSHRLTAIHAEIGALIDRLYADNELLEHNLALLRAFHHADPLPPDIHTAMGDYRRAVEENWADIPASSKYRIIIALANYGRLAGSENGDGTAQLSHEAKVYELAIYEKLLEFQLRNPKQRDENPAEFLNMVVRLLAVALDLERFDLFTHYSIRLKKYESQLEFYRSIVYLYLVRFLKAGEFTEATAYIEQHRLRERLPEMQARMRASRYAIMAFFCGQLYFVAKNVPATVFWFDQVIAHKPPENMPHLRCAAYFLKVAVQADHLDFDFQNAVNALRRWCERQQLHDEIHRAALVLLRHLLSDPRVNRLAATECLADVRQLFLLDAKYEQLGFLIAWAESRLTGAPLEAAVKEFL